MQVFHAFGFTTLGTLTNHEVSNGREYILKTNSRGRVTLPATFRSEPLFEYVIEWDEITLYYPVQTVRSYPDISDLPTEELPAVSHHFLGKPFVRSCEMRSFAKHLWAFSSKVSHIPFISFAKAA